MVECKSVHFSRFLPPHALPHGGWNYLKAKLLRLTYLKILYNTAFPKPWNTYGYVGLVIFFFSSSVKDSILAVDKVSISSVDV